MKRRPFLSILLLAALSGCAQCPDPFAPPPAPVDRVVFPTGLALHPTEPVLFVASSNFDDLYSTGAVLAARLDWLVANLAIRDHYNGAVENPWTGAARVPSFGQFLRVSADGNHLFHVTRQQSILVDMDVAVDGDEVRLGCGSSSDTAVADCTQGSHTFGLSRVDPYGLAVERRGNEGYRAYVGRATSGWVSAVDIRPGRPGSERTQLAWEKNLGDTQRGTNMTILPAAGGQPPFLLATGHEVDGTNLNIGRLWALNLWRAPDDDTQSANLLEGAGTIDTRGLVFNAAHTRAYVVSKLPPALLELDVSRRADGSPRMSVMRMTPLGKDPSLITMYEPPGGQALILAASFRDNLLMAVDVDTFTEMGVLRDIGKGPFDVAVDPAHGLAFVSCFSDDTVAVVALPRAAGELRFHVAARLGIPRNTASTNPDLDRLLPALPTPRF